MSTDPTSGANLTALIWAGRGQDSLPGLLRDAAAWLEAQEPATVIVWNLIGEVREDSAKGDETSVVLTVELLGDNR